MLCCVSQQAQMQSEARRARTEWRQLTGLIYLLMALLVPYFINFAFDMMQFATMWRVDALSHGAI